MLFDKKLLEKLIDEKYTNCVLVNKEIKAPEKDFKAVIKNNRVVKIGVEFSGENAFFSAPLYKFSRTRTVCVIGLGYVGLPKLFCFAKTFTKKCLRYLFASKKVYQKI